MTTTELRFEAKEQCPYARGYNGREPWVEGYLSAAEKFEGREQRAYQCIAKDMQEQAADLRHWAGRMDPDDSQAVEYRVKANTLEGYAKTLYNPSAKPNNDCPGD